MKKTGLEGNAGMEQLRDAMKHAKLTKTSRIIGEYVLDHETDACFMTSTELATELDVSEASVIRLFRLYGLPEKPEKVPYRASGPNLLSGGSAL